MNQVTAMRVFVRVIDCDSFSVAARQLGMSAAAVTRHVNMLEAHLNVKLINRSTRNLSLTEAGQEYLVACRSVLDTIDEVESNVVRTTRLAHGTLKIGTTTAFASTYLCNLLVAYSSLHPAVEFDIRTFDSHFDIIESGFDIGFTHQPQARSSLVCRPLMVFEEMLVASPAYLKAQGEPKHPSALRTHDLLNVTDGLSRSWDFDDESGSYRIQSGRNVLRTSSPEMAHAAAVNDMGIALLPTSLVRRDVEQGRLRQLLAHFQVSNADRRHALIYPGRSQLTAKVRTFVDFTVSYFRPLEQPTSLRVVA